MMNVLYPNSEFIPVPCIIKGDIIKDFLKYYRFKNFYSLHNTVEKLFLTSNGVNNVLRDMIEVTSNRNRYAIINGCFYELDWWGNTIIPVVITCIRRKDNRLDFSYNLEEEELVVFANNGWNRPMKGRFIKNLLKITKRKQIINVSEEKMRELFGDIVSSMSMMDASTQKELTTNFFLQYRESSS